MLQQKNLQVQNKMSKLLIVGAGGHGKVIADTAALNPHWNEIAFLDDCYPQVYQVHHWKVINKINYAHKLVSEYKNLVIGLGNNQLRMDLFNQMLNLGFNIVSIIHPNAYISSYVKIAEGTVVFANAVININAVIGRVCIINSGAVVEHDCVLEDAVHISPGANLAGGVKVGASSWVGIGAKIIEKINIGKNTKIGAGAVVINNITDNVTAVGVPAKVIKDNS